MTAVVSFVFRVIQFPHEGRIFTIDQLSFTRKNPNSPTGLKILSIEKSTLVTESVKFGLYPSLMGTFSFPTPVLILPDYSVDFLLSLDASDSTIGIVFSVPNFLCSSSTVKGNVLIHSHPIEVAIFETPNLSPAGKTGQKVYIFHFYVKCLAM